MGSGASGIYNGTSGAVQASSSAISAASMHQDAINWIRQMQSQLRGNQKKRFNTACVVVDVETGRAFHGRNRGIREEEEIRNSMLFGDSKSGGLLPSESISGYEIGNCAEVHAVNKALNAGAKIENLQMITVHATKKRMGELKAACENCTYAFKGRVKGNYSGWTE